MKNSIKYLAPKLTYGQTRIIKELIKPTEKLSFYTICTPRGFGKSFMAIQIMLYFALSEKNIQIMYITPVHQQGSRIFKELVKGLENSKLIKKYNAAEKSLIMINGSEIYFKSIEKQPENIRGNHIEYIICDEAAKYKDVDFDMIIRPMLKAKGKKCILLSTPRGKNYFFKLYTLGIDNEQPYYYAFKGEADECYNSEKYIEEFELAKKSLPDSIFRQEYLAEFVDDGGSVFDGVSKVATLSKWQDPVSSDVYYAGIDIAISGDYFVMTVLNRKGDIVFAYRDTKKQMSYMLKQIEIVFKKYNPRYTLVETNGIGGGIYEYIAKLHRSVSPFITTNDSKQDIIEDLIFGIQEQDIHLPTIEFFPHYVDEMNTFSFTYSPKTRRVMYGSLPGCHDDCVMSLAIANHARKTGATKGIYHIY